MSFKMTDYSIGADIFAGSLGIRVPIHRTIDTTKIAPDALGNKLIPAGTFFMDAGNGYARPLPRAIVTADTAANTPIIPVSSALSFFAQDVLTTLVPSGKVTIASSGGGWAAGDTITITIAGQPFVYTVVAEDIGSTLVATNTAIAAKIDLLLDGQANTLVTSSASQTVVYLSSTSNLAHTLTAADTGANGTATAGSATLVANQPVGTVLSVDPVGLTVTLTANTATALIAGQAIGTQAKALGMIVQTLLIDEADGVGVAAEQGLYTSASVRRELLPYYDELIKADLPEIQVV